MKPEFLKEEKKFFLLALISMFVQGLIYLVLALWKGQIIAIRDIVLFVYILFLPLVSSIFSTKKDLQTFLIALVTANIFSILIGRLFIFGSPGSYYFSNFIEQSKLINFGFCYSIAAVFLVPLYFMLKKNLHRFAVLFLVAVNLYMIVIIAQRTLWVALLTVGVFLFCYMKKKFIYFLRDFVFIFLFVFTLLYYTDFKLSNSGYVITGNNLKEKISSFSASVKAKSMLDVIHFTFAEQSKNAGPIPEERDTMTKAQINDWNYKVDDTNQNLGSKQNRLSAQGTIQKFIRRMYAWSYNVQGDSLFARYGIYWRFRVWKQLLEFGFQNPVFGMGFGLYPEWNVYYNKQLYKRQLNQRLDSVLAGANIIPAHNHLVTIFYKLGLIGIFLFLSTNFYILRRGVNGCVNATDDFTKNFLIGCVGGLIFWHVAALFFDLIDSPSSSVFLWILSGFIFSGIYSYQKEYHA